MGHEQLRAIVRASEKLGPDQRGIALVTSDLLEDVLEDLDKSRAAGNRVAQECGEVCRKLTLSERETKRLRNSLDYQITERARNCSERDTARAACDDLRKRVTELEATNASLRSDRASLDLEAESLRKRMAEIEGVTETSRGQGRILDVTTYPDGSVSISQRFAGGGLRQSLALGACEALRTAAKIVRDAAERAGAST